MTRKPVAIMILMFSMALSAAAHAAVKANMKKVSGTVQYRTSATSGWKPATEGLSLGEGASVKTGSGATAVLVWNGDNMLKLTPLTEVKIDALKASAAGMDKSDVSLSGGKVLARAGKLSGGNSEFSVRTPTAVAGVRGTVFEFGVDPVGGQNVVSVVEGTVAFESGGVEILVQEGFESVVMPGEVPEDPAPIPPDRLDNLKTENSQLQQDAGGTSETGDSGSEQKENSGEKTDSGGQPEVDTSAVEDAIDTALDNAVQEDITDLADGILDCPAGGGCIQGNVEF